METKGKFPKEHLPGAAEIAEDELYKQVFQFERKEKVGEGAFGKVYRGVDHETGKEVAIKVVDMDGTHNSLWELQNEMIFLAQSNIPQVAKYYTSFWAGGTTLWLIMEYVGGGNVCDLILPGPMGEDAIAICLAETLKSLAYLHAQGFLHRDIKAENLLVSESGQVKLADFGLASERVADGDLECAGSLLWMAPEVIEAAHVDEKSDIWSLGITAIELAAGRPPHSTKTSKQVYKLITDHPAPSLYGKYSASLKDFVTACLKKESKERPSAEELLRHKFVRKTKKKKLLVPLVKRLQEWRKEHEGEAREKSVAETLREKAVFDRQTRLSVAQTMVDVGEWEFE